MPDRQFLILRKHLFWVTVILSTVVIAAFSVAAVALWQGHQANLERQRRLAHDTVLTNRFQHSLCIAQNHSNDALHRVLSLAEALGRRQKNITPEQHRESVRFYRQALALVPDLACSNTTRQPTG